MKQGRRQAQSFSSFNNSLVHVDCGLTGLLLMWSFHGFCFTELSPDLCMTELQLDTRTHTKQYLFLISHNTVDTKINLCKIFSDDLKTNRLFLSLWFEGDTPLLPISYDYSNLNLTWIVFSLDLKIYIKWPEIQVINVSSFAFYSCNHSLFVFVGKLRHLCDTICCNGE